MKLLKSIFIIFLIFVAIILGIISYYNPRVKQTPDTPNIVAPKIEYQQPSNPIPPEQETYEGKG